MNSLEKLTANVAIRFDSLIAEGEDVLRDGEMIPAKYGYNELNNSHYEQQSAYRKLNWPKFVEWRTKMATLLAFVLPKDHIHYPAIASISKLKPTADRLEWGVSMLRAVKNDLEAGFLDRIFLRIEAEVASDYMGQAEELLAEGSSGRFNHVPSAVLAGAVLEKSLRKICENQIPPIDTLNAKGAPKTLTPLIDDLKKANVFNELKAKQLRAWADIRNSAAHGSFEEFNRTDVEQMIHGVSNFLTDYLA